MRRMTRTLAIATLLATALLTAGCEAPFPEAPASVGEQYPSGGVPTLFPYTTLFRSDRKSVV